MTVGNMKAPGAPSLRDYLEPQAADYSWKPDPQISIAISLKRIADAIAPTDGSSIGSTLFYIEQAIRGGNNG